MSLLERGAHCSPQKNLWFVEPKRILSFQGNEKKLVPASSFPTRNWEQITHCFIYFLLQFLKERRSEERTTATAGGAWWEGLPPWLVPGLPPTGFSNCTFEEHLSATLPLSLCYQKNKGQINWIMKNENENPEKQKTLVYFPGLDPNGISSSSWEERREQSHPAPPPITPPPPQILLLTFYFFSLVLFQLVS